MRLHHLLHICFLISVCVAVNRDNFKTCKQSSFCTRQRGYTPDAAYKIAPESIKIADHGISAYLAKAEGNQTLEISIGYLAFSTFRVTIDEVNAERKRYRLSAGDALRLDPKLYPVKVDRTSDSVVLSGSKNEKMVMNFDPFSADFFLDNVLIEPAKATTESNLENTLPEDTQNSENLENSEPHESSDDVDFLGFVHAYGIPEHADNLVLKPTDKGDPYRLYNLDVFEYELDSPMALYGTVPLLWALNPNHTIGLFWHNPSETWIDIQYSEHPTDGFLAKLPRLFSKPESYVKTRWMSESGVIDAFVILGHAPSDVTRAYAHLTGTTPLPPLFALGYHQSRWNYNDQDDVLTVDQQFDAHKIPVDVIWLDIEHTDGKRYFTWDQSKFPNPSEMVDKLLAKGRKLVTVVDPHIKKDSGWNIYNDAHAKDILVKTHDGADFDGWCWPGSSVWPDFTSPHVRRWWSEMFLQYEPKQSNSVFSWNDMGEPSVFNGPEVSMHKDAVHAGGWEHRDVHNIYGLYIHQATWEGHLLRSGGKERPFVLTRAFFAGSQRTCAVWTGDNTADWGHLRMSIPMSLSLSISGIILTGADVGGFFGNPDNELLTRWYQAGAYQPFFRAHAHMDTKRREPWLVPEPYLHTIRDAIVTRYQLLPYWYTMFARAEADGQPVMAPMWYHFRHLENTYNLELQYMIGEAVLVRPVTTSGASSVDVYLPPGTWYHFPTLQGEGTISFPVDLSVIPVFYRGGWIIPRRERVRRSSWKMRDDPFTLYVCLDPTLSEAHGFLYLDDYHSISRETARFFRIIYHANSDPVVKGPAGGHLRFERIPVPGTTVLPDRDPATSSPVPQIERIVFVGLSHEIERVTVIERSGTRRSVEFTQDPDSQSADQRYFGSLRFGVLVVRQPLVNVADDWELHLVTGTEMKGDL
ncbi:unnamed protein product [Echinostoma caproni]|uniref:Glucosidase II subunit alpha n=1 Tax=Echinostoma caproni TaxID=27848 RepID=A0A183AHL4_9TREM|nr:unnamed protein product [Echinostoma caproni]